MTELATTFLPTGRTSLEVPPHYSPQPRPEKLLESWLSRLSPLTQQAYASDLRDFTAFLGMSGPAAAATWMLSLEQGALNQAVLDYLADLARRNKAPATIGRRLAALKSVLAAGRLLGLTTVHIEVRGPRVETYRDTTGPTLERLGMLLANLQARAKCHNAKAIRDLAIVRLLFNRGLRKAEAIGLDVKHYDREKGRVSILGKARGAREWVTVSPKTIAALDAWLVVRGTAAGPIFIPFTGMYAGRRGRLTARNVNRIFKPFGIRPHGLRHASITNALEATGGDIVRVQAFSRHRNVNTVLRYNDQRLDAGGKISTMLDDLDIPTPSIPSIAEADLAGLREKAGRRVRAALAGKTIRAIAAAEGVTPARIRESILWAERRIPNLRPRLELAGVRKGEPR